MSGVAALQLQSMQDLQAGAARTAQSLLPHRKPCEKSSAWLQARVDELLKEHKSQSISALLRLEAELADARTALAQVSPSRCCAASQSQHVCLEPCWVSLWTSAPSESTLRGQGRHAHIAHA